MRGDVVVVNGLQVVYLFHTTMNLTRGNQMSDELFEQFWQAGMRKGNKKKARPLFNRLLKSYRNMSSPEGFTEMLIADIQARLKINQLGFAEMLPTTYLNGERWNDEIKGPSNGQTNGRKQADQRTGFQKTQDAYHQAFPETADFRVVGENEPSVRAVVSAESWPRADRDLAD